ncbi:hypothetical protein ACT3SZ_02015 [Corynebacterium sp. AOP40-9SA-29]|uniref:hypothetical protein n=1 Tax=Corynebacterium sp. AOP40-9SA-29 TaxID=3457677 RepID=UPI0040333881
MSTLLSRTSRTSRVSRFRLLAAAVPVTAALALGGCVIGEVDRDGDPAGQTAQESSVVESPDPTTGSTAPTASATSDPAAPSTSSSPQPGSLDVPEVSGSAGVALLDDGALRTGGSLADLADAAWSTSKVPVAIAALTNAGGDGQNDLDGLMRQAITVSDNDAAEALWASLGDEAAAAAATQDVLRQGGDTTTTVPAQKLRAEFSTFGQTTWTLGDQARFAAGLRCVAGSAPVLEAMGEVAAGQDYGLGRLDGARFKGGWGPGEDGSYLVRQFGLIPAQDGTMVPVAVAATAPDGSYASAQVVLDEVAESLRETIAGAHGVPAEGGC